MIELTFLKELIVTKQVHQKNEIYITIGIFLMSTVNLLWMHVILMMSINLNDIAILNISGADYRCIINGISKRDALNLLKNANLTKKGVL